MKFGVEVVVVHEQLVQRIVEADNEEDARILAMQMVEREKRYGGRVSETRRCSEVFVAS